MIFSPKNLTCNSRNITLQEKWICYSAALKKRIYLGTWSGSFHEKWKQRFFIITSLFFHVISLLFNNNRRYNREKKSGVFSYPGGTSRVKKENSVLPILIVKNFEQKIYFCFQFSVIQFFQLKLDRNYRNHFLNFM